MQVGKTDIAGTHDSGEYFGGWIADILVEGSVFLIQKRNTRSNKWTLVVASERWKALSKF